MCLAPYIVRLMLVKFEMEATHSRCKALEFNDIELGQHSGTSVSNQILIGPSPMQKNERLESQPRSLFLKQFLYSRIFLYVLKFFD